MKLYGCEVVAESQLSPPIDEFCRRIKARVLRIPVRQQGLTSSGIINHCYGNVSILMKLFGGRGIVGWVITPLSNQSEGENFSHFLMGHAVWLNRENRASCVTAKSWSEDHQALYEMKGKMYFDYIVCSAHVDIPVPALRNVFVAPTLPNAMCVLIEGDQRLVKKIHLNDLSRGKKEKVFFAQEQIDYAVRVFNTIRHSYDDAQATREIVRVLEVELGGKFSDRSTSTGRTYSEIREDRLRRIAP